MNVKELRDKALTDKQKILFRRICQYSIEQEDLFKPIPQEWLVNWHSDELDIFTKECAKWNHYNTRKKYELHLSFPIVDVFNFLIFKLLTY